MAPTPVFIITPYFAATTTYRWVSSFHPCFLLIYNHTSFYFKLEKYIIRLYILSYLVWILLLPSSRLAHTFLLGNLAPLLATRSYPRRCLPLASRSTQPLKSGVGYCIIQRPVKFRIISGRWSAGLRLYTWLDSGWAIISRGNVPGTVAIFPPVIGEPLFSSSKLADISKQWCMEAKKDGRGGFKS